MSYDSSTAPEDYILLSQSVSFEASSNASVVSIIVVNDDVLENEEVFIVSVNVFSGQQRVDLTLPNARVSITSDDGRHM